MGETFTGQRTYRSKNRSIPSSEYAPYLSRDMFVINLDSFFKHCNVYYDSFTCFSVDARCFPDGAKLIAAIFFHIDLYCVVHTCIAGELLTK